jgi:hypothetical protein
MQRTAWIFGTLFLIVFALTNIPAFNDAQGYNFGLFKIDPIDNIVHLLTAILCIAAALHSTVASRWLVGIFGTFYGLDALVGMLTQKGLLDFTVFLQAAADPSGVFVPDFSIHNFLVNGPHIGISAAMVLSATLFYPWVMKRRSFLDLCMLWNLLDRKAW